MPERDIDQLGDLQKAVLEVLWDAREATVREVQEALQGDPPPAYTTVLTVLQKLTKSGWVTHRSEGRSYIYRPLCSRDEAGRSAMHRVLDSVFAGDRMLALQQLIGEKPLDEAEVDALRALIRRSKEEQNDA